MKNSTEKLDINFDRYYTENNPEIHRNAIRNLLDQVDLADSFDELMRDKKSIKEFFLLWEMAGKLEENKQDKIGLQKMGSLSKKFYNKKEYKKLHELFYNILLGNLVGFMELEGRGDFKKITDHDLYTKNIIPSEILFQYFLIESAVKTHVFEWNRCEEVMIQNLACLMVCFMDVYDFFCAE